MQQKLATRGARLSVWFHASDERDSPTYEVYMALPKADRAALLVTMKKLAEMGSLHNTEKFKRVEGTDLWEIKKHQHRFLGFFMPGGRFIIAAYEQKKHDRLRASTVERATVVKRQIEGKEVTAHAR